MIVKKIASLSGIAVLSLGLLAGCATNSAVEEAQSDSQRALEMAEEALSVAREASSKADSAQSSADQANRCCEDQQEKLDRALERMQQK